MPGKTKEQRLFGAACLKVKLTQRGVDPKVLEIYHGALEDLDLREEEVDSYLETHLGAVEKALAAGPRGQN